ncbi:MAG: hypothetical protein ACO37D_07435 [Rhodothermales bacterium]|jgi:hypothetical protein
MIVWKVIDDGCPICAKMGEFDAELIVSMGYDLRIIRLEMAALNEHLATYIKSEIMGPDGTVDIPMYILEVDYDFVGSVIGDNTKGELERKLLQITP